MTLNRCFLDAWEAGMLVASTTAEQHVLEAIADGISLPTQPPGADDLVPLTEAEKIQLADRAFGPFQPFRGRLPERDDCRARRGAAANPGRVR